MIPEIQKGGLVGWGKPRASGDDPAFRGVLRV